jgi:hypothetical protein
MNTNNLLLLIVVVSHTSVKVALGGVNSSSQVSGIGVVVTVVVLVVAFGFVVVGSDVMTGGETITVSCTVVELPAPARSVAIT